MEIVGANSRLGERWVPLLMLVAGALLGGFRGMGYGVENKWPIFSFFVFR